MSHWAHMDVSRRGNYMRHSMERSPSPVARRPDGEWQWVWGGASWSWAWVPGVARPQHTVSQPPPPPPQRMYDATRSKKVRHADPYYGHGDAYARSASAMPRYEYDRSMMMHERPLARSASPEHMYHAPRQERTHHSKQHKSSRSAMNHTQSELAQLRERIQLLERSAGTHDTANGLTEDELIEDVDEICFGRGIALVSEVIKQDDVTVSAGAESLQVNDSYTKTLAFEVGYTQMDRVLYESDKVIIDTGDNYGCVFLVPRQTTQGVTMARVIATRAGLPAPCPPSPRRGRSKSPTSRSYDEAQRAVDKAHAIMKDMSPRNRNHPVQQFQKYRDPVYVPSSGKRPGQPVSHSDWPPQTSKQYSDPVVSPADISTPYEHHTPIMEGQPPPPPGAPPASAMPAKYNVNSPGELIKTQSLVNYYSGMAEGQASPTTHHLHTEAVPVPTPPRAVASPPQVISRDSISQPLAPKAAPPAPPSPKAVPPAPSAAPPPSAPKAVPLPPAPAAPAPPMPALKATSPPAAPVPKVMPPAPPSPESAPKAAPPPPAPAPAPPAPPAPKAAPPPPAPAPAAPPAPKAAPPAPPVPKVAPAPPAAPAPEAAPAAPPAPKAAPPAPPPPGGKAAPPAPAPKVGGAPPPPPGGKAAPPSGAPPPPPGGKAAPPTPPAPKTGAPPPPPGGKAAPAAPPAPKTGGAPPPPPGGKAAPPAPPAPKTGGAPPPPPGGKAAPAAPAPPKSGAPPPPPGGKAAAPAPPAPPKAGAPPPPPGGKAAPPAPPAPKTGAPPPPPSAGKAPPPPVK